MIKNYEVISGNTSYILYKSNEMSINEEKKKIYIKDYDKHSDIPKWVEVIYTETGKEEIFCDSKIPQPIVDMIIRMEDPRFSIRLLREGKNGKFIKRIDNIVYSLLKEGYKLGEPLEVYLSGDVPKNSHSIEIFKKEEYKIILEHLGVYTEEAYNEYTPNMICTNVVIKQKE